MTLDQAPITDAAGAISRRTVVRGAAITAWTVPAVTLVTAAPAFALGSPNLVITVSGSYATNSEVVNYTLSANNGGASASHGLVLVLGVPTSSAPHSTAPVFTAPAGWTLSGVATLSDGAWKQTLTRASLPKGTESVSGTITFQEAKNASPFERWGGKSFAFVGSLVAANGTANLAPGVVAAASPSSIDASSGTPFGKVGSVDPFYSWCAVGSVWNAGYVTVGRIKALVKIPKGSGYYSSAPEPVKHHSGWRGLDGNGTPTGNGQPVVVDAGTTWNLSYETTTTDFSPSGVSPNGTGAQGAQDGPASENVRPPKFPNLYQKQGEFVAFFYPTGSGNNGTHGVAASVTFSATDASGQAAAPVTRSNAL